MRHPPGLVLTSQHRPPAEPVTLHVGSRGNVMPERATLELTLRALSDVTLERLHAAVRAGRQCRVRGVRRRAAAGP
jgi:hippurate hydrolase